MKGKKKTAQENQTTSTKSKLQLITRFKKSPGDAAYSSCEVKKTSVVRAEEGVTRSQGRLADKQANEATTSGLCVGPSQTSRRRKAKTLSKGRLVGGRRQDNQKSSLLRM